MAGCNVSIDRTGVSTQLSIVDALHRRLTFRQRQAKQSLAPSVLLWCIFQIGTLYLDWTGEQWQWLFTASSFPAQSLGLVFAIISHVPPPNVTHLPGNVAGYSPARMSSTGVVPRD